MEEKAHDPPPIGDSADPDGGGIRGSSSAEPVAETVIVMSPADQDAGERRPSGEDTRNDETEAGVKDTKPCVVDVKCGEGGGGGDEEVGEDCDGERVCRICHLSSEPLADSTATFHGGSVDLIQLGCGCKDELGISHTHCAEAWFKLKGNR